LISWNIGSGTGQAVHRPLLVNGPLEEFMYKRGRAKQHLSVLRQSIGAFMSVERPRVMGQFDEEAGQYRFEVPLERYPPDWALLLGDYAYNSRAALDYLISALVLSTGEKQRRTNEFPIYGIEREGWESIDQWWDEDPKGRIKRQLRGTPPGTKERLKQLQPFYGVPRVDPTRHPLLVLRELSNRDKHRRLNLLVRRATIGFVDAKGAPIYEGPSPQGRITDDREGDFYTVSLGVQGKRNGDLYVAPRYEVALDEPPELIGILIPALEEIESFVSGRVVPVVRGLLEKASAA
jgi:hypothetical protein